MGPFSMGVVLRLLLLCSLPQPPFFASAYPLAHSPASGSSGSSGDRPLERLEEHSFRFCSDRLLQGIQRACNNPFASYAWGSGGRKRSSLPQDEGDDQVSEEYLEESTEAGAGSGGRFGGRRDRNIVQACCRNSCTPSEFQRFCILSKSMTNRQRQRPQEPPLTPSTTTTTTTTPEPPKEGASFVPMLLRILSWGIPPSQSEGEEDQQQQQQRRREQNSRQEIPHSRQRLNLHANRHRGGHGHGHHNLNRHSARPQPGEDVVLSGFRFGEPSFPERGVVGGGGGGGGYSGWVRDDENEDATEAPANQTLGFPIGTHDGIQFNS